MRAYFVQIHHVIWSISNPYRINTDAWSCSDDACGCCSPKAVQLLVDDLQLLHQQSTRIHVANPPADAQAYAGQLQEADCWHGRTIGAWLETETDWLERLSGRDLHGAAASPPPRSLPGTPFPHIATTAP
eukprot:366052-Chlamydomonas_euryale.AAC.25